MVGAPQRDLFLIEGCSSLALHWQFFYHSCGDALTTRTLPHTPHKTNHDHQ
jgi:hypothetical protein